MKEFLERLTKLSVTTIIAFIWLLVSFIALSFGLSFAIYAGIVAIFFAVLSLRE